MGILHLPRAVFAGADITRCPEALFLRRPQCVQPVDIFGFRAFFGCSVAAAVYLYTPQDNLKHTLKIIDPATNDLDIFASLSIFFLLSFSCCFCPVRRCHKNNGTNAGSAVTSPAAKLLANYIPGTVLVSDSLVYTPRLVMQGAYVALSHFRCMVQYSYVLTVSTAAQCIHEYRPCERVSVIFGSPLPTQVNGLVHISQLADEFVANCEDHVKEGDTVRQVNHTNAQATYTHKSQQRARELLNSVGCRTRIECRAVYTDKLKKKTSHVLGTIFGKCWISN